MSSGGSTQYPTQALAGLWSQDQKYFDPKAFSTANVNASAGNAFKGIGDLSSSNPYWSPQGQSAVGASMTGAGMGYLPYSYMALNAGFDPQNAAYSQYFQQNQDQTRAEEAAAGVATTPYGAGISAGSDQNFNIQWQMDQLARMGQGANAASTIAGTGANLATTGQGLGMTGQGFGNQLTQQQIADYLNYVAANSANVGAWQSGVSSSLGGINQMYGTSAQTALAGDQMMGSAFGGLGQLAGTLGGDYMMSSALSSLAPMMLL